MKNKLIWFALGCVTGAAALAAYGYIYLDDSLDLGNDFFDDLNDDDFTDEDIEKDFDSEESEDADKVSERG
jgi:hypothetical protein